MNPPIAPDGAVAARAAEADHSADIATNVTHDATADTTATVNNVASRGNAALKAATTTSPKVWASTIAGAIAFSFWTIAAATFWKNTFTSDTLAALIASTTTIVAAAAAYFKADSLRSGG